MMNERFDFKNLSNPSNLKFKTVVVVEDSVYLLGGLGE